MAKKNTTKKEKVEEKEVLTEAEEIKEEEITTEESEEEKTTTPIEEESEEIIEAVTLDNSPISPIILEEETEVVPKDFTPAIPKKVSNNKSGLSVFKGRVYKELNNGRGIFADNGETFNLSDIK
nr:MAG TPA: hypothetical protein [Caudoviricetes sp.]